MKTPLISITSVILTITAFNVSALRGAVRSSSCSGVQYTLSDLSTDTDSRPTLGSFVCGDYIQKFVIELSLPEGQNAKSTDAFNGSISFTHVLSAADNLQPYVLLRTFADSEMKNELSSTVASNGCIVNAASTTSINVSQSENSLENTRSAEASPSMASEAFPTTSLEMSTTQVVFTTNTQLSIPEATSTIVYNPAGEEPSDQTKSFTVKESISAGVLGFLLLVVITAIVFLRRCLRRKAAVAESKHYSASWADESRESLKDGRQEA